MQKLDARAGRSSKSGWGRLVPTHPALFKPKRECRAAGLDGLQSPTPGPVGILSLGVQSPLCVAAEPGRGLVTPRGRDLPPPPPLPQPWERLSGEILVSRNGRGEALRYKRGKSIQSYELLEGRTGFSFGFSPRRREQRTLWNKVELEGQPPR